MFDTVRKIINASATGALALFAWRALNSWREEYSVKIKIQILDELYESVMSFYSQIEDPIEYLYGIFQRMHLDEIEGSKDSNEEKFFIYLKKMCLDDTYPNLIKSLSPTINDIKRLNLKEQELKIYLHEEINKHVNEILQIYSQIRETIFIGVSLRDKNRVEDLYDEKDEYCLEMGSFQSCLVTQYIESTMPNPAKEHQEKFFELYKKIIKYYLFPKKRKWWSKLWFGDDTRNRKKENIPKIPKRDNSTIKMGIK